MAKLKVGPTINTGTRLAVEADIPRLAVEALDNPGVK